MTSHKEYRISPALSSDSVIDISETTRIDPASTNFQALLFCAIHLFALVVGNTVS